MRFRMKDVGSSLARTLSVGGTVVSFLGLVSGLYSLLPGSLVIPARVASCVFIVVGAVVLGYLAYTSSNKIEGLELLAIEAHLHTLRLAVLMRYFGTRDRGLVHPLDASRANSVPLYDASFFFRVSLPSNPLATGEGADKGAAGNYGDVDYEFSFELDGPRYFRASYPMMFWLFGDEGHAPSHAQLTFSCIDDRKRNTMHPQLFSFSRIDYPSNSGLYTIEFDLSK